MTWPALLKHTQMERDNAVDERNTLRATLTAAREALRSAMYLGTAGDLILEIEGEHFRVRKPSVEQIEAIHKWMGRRSDALTASPAAQKGQK